MIIFLLGYVSVKITDSYARQENNINLTFNHYYSYEELSDALKSLAKAYPKFLKLISIGKSYEGRDIWLMIINNPDAGPDKSKPAMYIDGNIHGNEVQGGEVCLYTIWYLMKNYGKLDKVTELVDQKAFYILPTINPDGRAYWFNKPGSLRSGTKPVDNDNDGLYDEDPPDDIDGDGEILTMRKKDPDGMYKPSKYDPRIMVRVKPGEKGEYILLGSEGIDNDGDGLVNEDGPGGYDPNRNWPFDWQPPYIQYGSGDYPFSYPETRAGGKFILEHPNIAAVQSYHNSGGMILRGPGAQKVGEYPASDKRVYDYIGKMGEKILPFYRYYVIWKDLYTVHGGTINWTGEGLGIFSFSNELWSSAKYYYKSGEARRRGDSEAYEKRQAERLKFDDLLEMGKFYREWKPFKHPTYGDIEIGGWSKRTNRVPPSFQLEDLCHRNCMFTLFHADQMPVIEIRNVEIKKLGEDVFRVRVEVANDRIIPTISAIASKNKTTRPDIVTISGSNIKVLSGGIVVDKWYNRIEPVEHKPERIILRNGIKGNSQILIQWIVKGYGNVNIKLDCVKGGIREKKVSL